MASNQQTEYIPEWILEQLAAENVDTATMTNVFYALQNNRGGSFSPSDVLKARIILNSLSQCQSIDLEIVSHLKQLHDIASYSSHPDITYNNNAFLPPGDLMNQVKTEYVFAQCWRNNITVNPRDAVNVISEVFGTVPGDRTREDLINCLNNPGRRMAIQRDLPDVRQIIDGLHRFAAAAKEALPETMMSTVLVDLTSGRYDPGQEAAAHPAAPIYQETNPMLVPPSRAGYTSAPGGYQSPAQLGAKRPRVSGQYAPLHAAMENLHRAGGADPLLQAEAMAEAAAQAARGGVQVPPPAGYQQMTPGSAGLGPRLQMPHRQTSNAAIAPLRRISVPHSADRALSTPGRELIKGRRQTKKWTAEETQALLDGVKLHGTNWAHIHNLNKDIWGKVDEDVDGRAIYYRTQVDLKDKWRNLIKFNNRDALEIKQAMEEEYAQRKAEEDAAKTLSRQLPEGGPGGAEGGDAADGQNRKASAKKLSSRSTKAAGKGKGVQMEVQDEGVIDGKEEEEDYEEEYVTTEEQQVSEGSDENDADEEEEPVRQTRARAAEKEKEKKKRKTRGRK